MSRCSGTQVTGNILYTRIASGVCSVFGLFTMETLIATAFGQYVDVQRGGADQLTKAADIIFRSNAEGSAIPPELLFTLLCKKPFCSQCMCIVVEDIAMCGITVYTHV